MGRHRPRLQTQSGFRVWTEHSGIVTRITVVASGGTCAITSVAFDRGTEAIIGRPGRVEVTQRNVRQSCTVSDGNAFR